MSRITQWIQARRIRRMNRYMEKIRNGSPEEKQAFLHECIKRAYYPLYLAWVTLGAKNYVHGTIQEQTTGEWFKIEMRKIDEPLKDSK